MALPTLMYGGPSPRIRDLANHDELSRRKLAASFGVSRTTVADGFGTVTLLAGEECDVISVVPNGIDTPQGAMAQTSEP